MSTQHPRTTRPDKPTPQGKRAEDATPADAARDEAAADWAEHDMTLRPDSPTALHGQDAAAHGRSALLDALGGPEALERAVRGRKTLGHNRPAGRSPKRQVTVPADLDARILAFIEAGGARDFSALARTALDEYLDRHDISA
ncbi:hypothetical protein [Kineococcus sp. R86509]|uniref:hypothetical protein n=1 Tax=Kineococcus sp. R86509 TaxID=3093851 RepID=UPI0036D2355B